jgi:hypothetical protein
MTIDIVDNVRVPGCTCARPLRPSQDAPDASNVGKPRREQLHQLGCALLPRFEGWCSYAGETESAVLVNPDNPEIAFTWYEPGCDQLYYLRRADVERFSGDK